MRWSRVARSTRHPPVASASSSVRRSVAPYSEIVAAARPRCPVVVDAHGPAAGCTRRPWRVVVAGLQWLMAPRGPRSPPRTGAARRLRRKPTWYAAPTRTLPIRPSAALADDARRSKSPRPGSLCGAHPPELLATSPPPSTPTDGRCQPRPHRLGQRRRQRDVTCRCRTRRSGCGGPGVRTRSEPTVRASFHLHHPGASISHWRPGI